jgi:hypothetical protein
VQYLTISTEMSIVGLNIGGHIFHTTKSTLCPNGTSNFFSGLLSGNIPSTKDAKGNYFIDRDGQYFVPILEFLRTGEVVVPPQESRARLHRSLYY